MKLIKQRAASDFNLRKDAPDISYDREGRDNEPDGFFKDKKESYKLKKQMKMERRDLLYSTVAAIAAELVMIWLALGQRIQGVLPEAITASNHPISYVLVALVVFVVVMVASRFTLISGYNEICNRRPNIDSAVLVGSVATLIHTLFLFFNGRGVSDGTIPQYTAVAGLLLAMNTLGKYCFVSRTIKNFNFLCGTRDQYSFIHINDENGAIKMGDGIVTDEPVIGYPVKINGVSDFIRTARSESPSERLIRKMIVYFWGAALLVGFISMFTQMSFMQGFSAIILMLCVAVPASTLLIANIPLLRIAKKAKSKGCIICGYDSIRHNTDMNAVIIEASQIFDGSNVKIHGVKTFGGCPVDRAILFAAGMTYAADSPAKIAFERVIDGDLEILPQVQKLVYEDKLGLSGIIEGKRVLLGNKELMRKHGIMCPTRLYESKYRQNGRSLTFLSIDGVVSAMFVLSYTANETVRKKLTALSDMGIGILISSTDSNITSEYLTGIFELPADSLKVLSADGSRLYNEETRKNTNCTPVADTVFTGSVMSYIDSVIGVSKINLNVRLATLIQCAAILIGFIIAGVTALISGISGLTAIHVIIFEIAWAILINIVSNAGKYD